MTEQESVEVEGRVGQVEDNSHEMVWFGLVLVKLVRYGFGAPKGAGQGQGQVPWSEWSGALE